MTPNEFLALTYIDRFMELEEFSSNSRIAREAETWYDNVSNP